MCGSLRYSGKRARTRCSQYSSVKMQILWPCRRLRLVSWHVMIKNG
ncbi:hypothetical protein OAN61_00920 [bacterium]|nr:hypothetical protein [bacterium]